MILNLKVQNYKSIEEVNIGFKQLNVLIGKNGAGKTTLISVINLIKGIAQGKNINTLANEIAPYGEFFNANLANKTAKFEIKVQSKQNNVYVYSFSVCFGTGNDLSARNDGRYYFTEESLFVLKHQSNEQECVFRRDVDERGAIRIGKDEKYLHHKTHDNISVLSTYAQDQVQEVANLLSEYSVIWMNQGSLMGRSLQYANDLNLDTIDGIAVGLYLKDRVAYDEAMGIIEEIIPGFAPPFINHLPLGPDEDNGGSSHLGYIVSWKDGAYVRDRSFSSDAISGGNNRVIYLILSLYYSGAKTCFVAEEVENGMHLGRLSELMDKLKMIGKNRKIQLFLTTHNYLILEDLLPKEVILAKLGEKGSEYIHLSDTSEYVDIKEDLGRDPTSKEMADSGLLFS